MMLQARCGRWQEVRAGPTALAFEANVAVAVIKGETTLIALAQGFDLHR